MNLICLDLDGTLEDSRHDMVAVVHRVRAALQLPARPDEAILPWVNRGMDPLYRACFDDYLKEDETRIAEVRRRYETDYLGNAVCKTELYPGIRSALPKLAESAMLALVTNKPERISRRMLEILRIDKHFTALIGGDTLLATKPDPALLREAAKRCGFDSVKGRAVMIGDTAADIKMGRAFGAATVWCAWGYATDSGEAPDLTAKRPEELPRLVSTLLS
ncbi:MAG: HAD-IA family hydrolase [Candidatus Manganitrophaceae bacterium]